MIEPETPGRDERLIDMTTPEVVEELKRHHDAEVTHRKAVTEHRHQVMVLADELIRHRPRDPEVPEEERGWKISPLARDVLGVTYQAFREALGTYWDKVAPDFSPDERPVLTDQDREDIRELYRKGAAKYKIAKHYGVAPATVRAIVNVHPPVVPEREEEKREKAEIAHGLREIRKLKRGIFEPEEDEEEPEPMTEATK